MHSTNNNGSMVPIVNPVCVALEKLPYCNMQCRYHTYTFMTFNFMETFVEEWWMGNGKDNDKHDKY